MQAHSSSKFHDSEVDSETQKKSSENYQVFYQDFSVSPASSHRVYFQEPQINSSTSIIEPPGQNELKLDIWNEEVQKSHKESQNDLQERTQRFDQNQRTEIRNLSVQLRDTLRICDPKSASLNKRLPGNRRKSYENDWISKSRKIQKSSRNNVFSQRSLMKKQESGKNRKFYEDNSQLKHEKNSETQPNDSFNEDMKKSLLSASKNQRQNEDDISMYLSLGQQFSLENQRHPKQNDSQKESKSERRNIFDSLNPEKPRQNMKAPRKGKSKQGLAQKFIKFMTGFYFTKNFPSYFKRALGMTFQEFDKLSDQAKRNKIKNVKQNLKDYKMKHRRTDSEVLVFLRGFTENEEQVIIRFFQHIARKSYAILFESVLRMSLKDERQNSQFKYIDKTGEDDLQVLFDQIMQKYIDFKSTLESQTCQFKNRLTNLLDSKNKSGPIIQKTNYRSTLQQSRGKNNF